MAKTIVSNFSIGHILTICGIILCSRKAVRGKGVYSLGFGILLATWVAIKLCSINLAANVNAASIRLLNILENSCVPGIRGKYAANRSYAIMSRELRNLKEIRVQMGCGLFYYDKGILLTALQIILNNTMTLILAH